MVTGANWSYTTSKTISQLFFITYMYVFDPAYWLWPQKLFQMIFFGFFFLAKIDIFEKNRQNRHHLQKKKRNFVNFFLNPSKPVQWIFIACSDSKYMLEPKYSTFGKKKRFFIFGFSNQKMTYFDKNMQNLRRTFVYFCQKMSILV